MPGEIRTKETDFKPYRYGLEDARLILSWDALGLEGVATIRHLIPSAPWYDERSLPIAKKEKGDFVLLSHSDWDRDYVDQLSRIGLGPDKDNILVFEGAEGMPMARYLLENPQSLDVLKRRIHETDTGMRTVFHSYCYSDDTAMLAERLGVEYLGTDSAQIRRFNDKVTFKQLCEKIGIEVAPGGVIYRTAPKEMEKELRGFLADHPHLFVRGDRGSSASSAHKVNVRNVGERATRMYGESEMERFLVEPFLELETSPSLLFRLTDEGVVRISPVAGQILDDNNTHQGNNYPSGLDGEVEGYIIENSFLLAEEMHRQGFRGELGYDWMITKSGDIFPAECNPRVTGATPSVHLASELRSGPYADGGDLYVALFNTHGDQLHTYVDLETVLRTCDLGDELLWNGQSKLGMVPSNFGPFRPASKFSAIAFAPEKRGLHELVSQITSCLGDEDAFHYVENSMQI